MNSNNTGGKFIEVYDITGQVISGDYALVGEGCYVKVYYAQDITYLIEFNSDYVIYSEKADIHYTSEYGIDILKNLSINDTFVNVRELIETDGEISILDKDNNALDTNVNIKTGDKFVVTFPSSQYFIHLSVKGDITGVGNISNDDVVKSYQILRKNIDVEDYYRLATDINEDGIIKINDIAKLYQYVNKKIESLEE